MVGKVATSENDELKERLIAKVEGYKKGPTILFFAGIHGNEHAGIKALEQTLPMLETEKMAGTVYGIIGNLRALQKNKRFIDEDLNRLWTAERILQLEKKLTKLEEEEEMQDLLNVIQNILRDGNGPFYFIDFHTTSSKSCPFITINDALINRKFAIQYPLPIILGIEEYLDGPMLSYVNQQGYVAIGFEAGQHQDQSAVDNTVSFIHLTLSFTGIIEFEGTGARRDHYQRLESRVKGLQTAFEIVYLHKIGEWDTFSMLPGFISFQKISKGMPLAIHNNQEILAPSTGRIFMPLYQSLGSDGFFIIHSISNWTLKFSAFLRRLKLDNLLVLLPGVGWEDRKRKILRVNLKTAKFLAKEFFHLFGYRVRVSGGHYLKLYNREKAAKKKMYRKTKWW